MPMTIRFKREYRGRMPGQTHEYPTGVADILVARGFAEVVDALNAGVPKTTARAPQHKKKVKGHANHR